jgi:signal transduction histidine kinase
METIRQTQARLLRSRWFPKAAIGMTLLILVGVIGGGTWHLREKIRAQMLGRDAAILHGLAQMVQLSQEREGGLGGEIKHLPDQIAVALQISELNQFNGVIATRLFDANGQFTSALPGNVSPLKLGVDDIAYLRSLKPFSRFNPEGNLGRVFFAGTTSIAESNRVVALQEIIIPLHRQTETAIVGAAQFILDGTRVATEFSALDWNLALQAGAAFCAGGGLIIVALLWAFRRLQRVNVLLVERTSRLLRANQELALSARTSAIGAIAAHLVHGLSSPLSGLQELATARAQGEQSGSEWQDLLANASQMRALIGEVVRVLGEERVTDHYEITLAELLALLESKIQPMAQRKGIRLEVQGVGEKALPNREANLILLILENLLRNALQATPPGGEVCLQGACEDGGVTFEVSDRGPGIPADLQAKLFQPCRSTKPGGLGIGLAISFQLARHLGATLELLRSGPEGSVFSLRLPAERSGPRNVLDPEPMLG